MSNTNKQLKRDSHNWEKRQIEEQKQDLKNIDVIYVVGLRKSINEQWDIGHWRHFGVYYVKNNKLERVWFYDSTKDKPSLWNHEYRCFESYVLGSDRTYEIIESLYYHVYGKEFNKAAYEDHKLPRIEFLSYFDGDIDKQEEIEKENLEELY